MAFGKCNGGGRRVASREAAPVLVVYFTMSKSRSAVLVDVSRTGVRLRGEDLPQTGEELILTMEGVRTYGSVVWSLGNECGVAFDEPLLAGSLERLRQSVSRAQGLSPELKAAYDDWMIGVAR